MSFSPYLGQPLKPATLTRDHREFFTLVTSGRDKHIDKVRCPDGMAVAGLNCAGKNCDNVTLNNCKRSTNTTVPVRRNRP